MKRLKWLTCIEVQHDVANASYYGEPEHRLPALQFEQKNKIK